MKQEARFNMRLDNELKEWLKDKAARDHVTMSHVIRESIRLAKSIDENSSTIV